MTESPSRSYICDSFYEALDAWQRLTISSEENLAAFYTLQEAVYRLNIYCDFETQTWNFERMWEEYSPAARAGIELTATSEDTRKDHKRKRDNGNERSAKRARPLTDSSYSGPSSSSAVANTIYPFKMLTTATALIPPLAVTYADHQLHMPEPTPQVVPEYAPAGSSSQPLSAYPAQSALTIVCPFEDCGIEITNTHVAIATHVYCTCQAEMLVRLWNHITSNSKSPGGSADGPIASASGSMKGARSSKSAIRVRCPMTKSYCFASKRKDHYNIQSWTRHLMTSHGRLSDVFFCRECPDQRGQLPQMFHDQRALYNDHKKILHRQNCRFCGERFREHEAWGEVHDEEMCGKRPIVHLTSFYDRPR